MSSETETKLCDVCQKNPIIGVCCVPSVPFSAGYCVECLKHNAHPWGILLANTWCLGGLDNAAPFWKKMVKDTCKHLGKTMEEFKADLAKCDEEDEKE